jgi:ADP-L-glycero-D-manno-heptose 6-epimerase
MIVVTGAAGFIGSCLVGELNAAGFFDIVLVDDFSNNLKSENLSGKKYTQKVNRNELESWLNAHHRFVQFIFHIGARTDTAETDTQIFEILNVN